MFVGKPLYSEFCRVIVVYLGNTNNVSVSSLRLLLENSAAGGGSQGDRAPSPGKPY
jgi:hypothetical protein